MKDVMTRRYLRKLMALPLIPSQNIVPVFEDLKNSACTEPLQRVITYIENTWILSTIWPPASWSVYMQSIRTNNDCEGWHRRINTKGKAKMSFHRLLTLLRGEAELVDIYVNLISEHKLRKRQKKHFQKTHAKLSDAWNEFEKGKTSPIELLRSCAYVYGPNI